MSGNKIYSESGYVVPVCIESSLSNVYVFTL